MVCLTGGTVCLCRRMKKSSPAGNLSFRILRRSNCPTCTSHTISTESLLESKTWVKQPDTETPDRSIIQKSPAASASTVAPRLDGEFLAMQSQSQDKRCNFVLPSMETRPQAQIASPNLIFTFIQISYESPTPQLHQRVCFLLFSNGRQAVAMFRPCLHLQSEWHSPIASIASHEPATWINVSVGIRNRSDTRLLTASQITPGELEP